MLFSGLLNHIEGWIVAFLFHCKLLLSFISFIRSLIFFDFEVVFLILDQDLTAVVVSVIRIKVFDWDDRRFIQTTASGFYHPWVLLLTLFQRGIGKTTFRLIWLEWFYPSWFVRVLFTWRIVWKVQLHRLRNICFLPFRNLRLNLWCRFSVFVYMGLMVYMRIWLCPINVKAITLRQLFLIFTFPILFCCFFALIWLCDFESLELFLLF